MSAPVKTPPTGKKAPGRWLRGRFLIVSIVFHLILVAVATYLVVQTFAPRKQTFKAGAPARNPEAEHKITMVKKQNAMSAPAMAKRVTTTGLSKVALPDMPITPTADPTTPTAITGIGGTGTAFSGAGGAGVGTGSGNGMPFFGLKNGGTGLVGTFYDFKRVSRDKAIDRIPKYADVVDRFTSGTWGPKTSKFYKSDVRLTAKVFFFPAIKDTEAGKAFQSPETAPGGWVAHYVGNMIPPADGTYRFVGFGDNVMIVKLGSAVVLDASDNNYTHRKREAAGKGISFRSKKSTPLFFGNWFTLQKGSVKRMEVAVGDEGGIFCAGLFIQKQGQEYSQGANNMPNLPLFSIGAFSDDQKAALRKFLPDSAFGGPVFTSGPSDANLLLP